jgi:hypothetical protein
VVLSSKAMKRAIVIMMLLGLVGAPLAALDCEPGQPDAMPCCQGDASSCHQEIGRAPDCCRASPAGPEGEGLALKVERAAAASLPVVAVLPALPAPAPARLAVSSSAPLDTSPSRPTILRL